MQEAGQDGKQVDAGQGASSPRAEHVAQTRAALVEAGRRLFGERGFGGFARQRRAPEA